LSLTVRGVFAPAATPFDPVSGDVDLVALRRLARRWLEAPLSGLVLFGSTGEGVALQPEERTRALEAVRAVMPDDLLLLAGIAAESTRSALHLAESSSAAGAQAVLVQPPAYYRPQLVPDALRTHFLHLADHSPVPVLLYQVPGQYSGLKLEAGLVEELSRHPNIVGIKDSSGELKSLGAYLDACDRSCAVLVGSGASLYGGLELGASGGIVAVAVLAPAAAAGLEAAFRGGRASEAGRLQEELGTLHREIVARYGVPGIKAALDLLGLPGGAPRPPLLPLGARERKAVAATLAGAGLIAA
jgi:4-hydroxy-2-oxoglutarate aldolase